MIRMEVKEAKKEPTFLKVLRLLLHQKGNRQEAARIWRLFKQSKKK